MTRISTVAALVVAGLSTLACSGLFSPRVVHSLQVQSDACGNYTVSVDAEASGRQLELFVDGALVESFRVDGRQVVQWVGSGMPGSSHSVVAQFSSRDPSTASVVIAPLEDAVELRLSQARAYSGEPIFLEAVVSEICAAGVSPTWTMSVDGGVERRGTMLPSNRMSRFEVSAHLGPGKYRGYSEVDLSPHNSEVDALEFYIEAPCSDYDADGLTTCAGDCDDNDNTVGTCEESTDRDGDGFETLAAGGTDCNDAHSGVHPGAVDGIDADGDGYKVRDGLDQDCDGVVDNGAEQAEDCDDTNARINPGRAELGTPNGVDDNCDGRIDEGTVAYDDDGDGFSENEGDCNDADDTVSPASPELPDCRDNNCNGDVDEGIAPIVGDDTYESNDVQADAHNLNTGGRNRFRHSFSLISRDTSDEEWFTFWSSDGPFDSWGIVATLSRGPEQARYEFSVLDSRGRVRSRRTLTGDAQLVSVSGRGWSDDSGMYFLRIRPLTLPRDYCPLTVSLLAR